MGMGTLMGVQAAGGIYSAYSQYQTGKRENEYYKYLADSSTMQSKYVEEAGQRQAEYEQLQGSREAAQVQEAINESVGLQRVALAANGVTGATAQDLEFESLEKGHKDMLAIKYNADLRSRTALEEAANQIRELSTQSVGYRMAGANALEAAKYNAFGSLLGSATSMAQTKMAWDQTSKGAAPKKTTSSGASLTYNKPSGRFNLWPGANKAYGR